MRVTNAVTAERKFDLALLFEAELTQRPGPRPPPAADRAEARRNWARFQETSRRVGSSPERERRTASSDPWGSAWGRAMHLNSTSLNPGG